MNLYDSNGVRSTKVKPHIRRLGGSRRLSSKASASSLGFLILGVIVLGIVLSVIAKLIAKIGTFYQQTIMPLLPHMQIFAIILLGILVVGIIILVLLRLQRIKRRFKEIKASWEISFHNWRT